MIFLNCCEEIIYFKDEDMIATSSKIILIFTLAADRLSPRMFLQ